MKKHVKLFEEFVSNPIEEEALLKQFATSATTMAAMASGKTHSVSVIVSDENGIHVEPVGGKTPVPPELSVTPPISMTPEGTM
jgi:hypothetical protein